MYYVMRRTPTTSGYTKSPTQTTTETRIGRRFVHIEPAKALAKRHLGRVIDLDSRREVANYA